ncbi:unnamed protein product [Rotaria socialis]|uniref:Uncharacterized protein n=1 Tax=Rotaria socialis TaxID=392032 RepID=A0A817U2V8_9BILA|nr:unnamed protein product [Rotaria socialis]
MSDHGSASAVDLKSIDIANKWCNNHSTDMNMYNIPCEKTSLVLIFHFAVDANSVSIIKCLIYNEMECSRSFPSILKKSNIINMFEHIYKRHQEQYNDITADYHAWCEGKVAQAMEKGTKYSAAPRSTDPTSDPLGTWKYPTVRYNPIGFRGEESMSNP